MVHVGELFKHSIALRSLNNFELQYIKFYNRMKENLGQ
jgi:hypothetical protein